MKHEARFLNPDPTPPVDLPEWRPSAEREWRLEVGGIEAECQCPDCEPRKVKAEFGFYHPAEDEQGGRYAE
jgi:hypothetical protein